MVHESVLHGSPAGVTTIPSIDNSRSTRCFPFCVRHSWHDFFSRRARLGKYEESSGEAPASGYSHRGRRARQGRPVHSEQVCNYAMWCLCLANLPFRHLELIRAHWSGQPDLTTFHTPALQALEKRCLKHFSSGMFMLVRAMLPQTDLSTWSQADRNKVAAFLPTYCVPLLAKLGHTDVLPSLQG